MIRSLILVPLFYLCWERLYFPFQETMLFDLSQVATTRVDKVATRKYVPSIDEIVSETPYTAWKKRSCPPSTQFVHSKLPSSATASTTPIPKIIHQTAKTHCLTPAFVRLTEQWKDTVPTYLLHDNTARNRFFHHATDVPHLILLLRNCIPSTNGAMLADLWRYALLYEYGGIYADLDTAPTAQLWELPQWETADAIFVVEEFHVLSQWFFAVSPKHPLLYYALQDALSNLLHVQDVERTSAAHVTGPHALHRAFQRFVAEGPLKMSVPDIGLGQQPVQSGTYVGTHNRSVTVLGAAEHENEFVRRQAIDAATKKRDYRTMGMAHFSAFPKHRPSNMSCVDAMWKDLMRSALTP